MTDHTPTPWVCRGQSVSDSSEHTVSLAYCGMVAGAGVCKDGKVRSFGVNQETANANAAFIVKAVNSHDALVITLKETRDALKALRDAVKANNKMNGREYIDVGIQVHSALDIADATLGVVGGSKEP